MINNRILSGTSIPSRVILKKVWRSEYLISPGRSLKVPKMSGID